MKTLNELKEANNDKLRKLERLTISAEKILKSTIQFFNDNAKPKNHTAGSGVLFEINDKFFIFTAAHVFTENHKEIYVIANKEPISLGGMLYTTPLPISGVRKEDKVDVVIIEIYKSIAKKLKIDYHFIHLSDLELGHYVDINTNYILAGYPITKTKKLWGVNDTLKSEPFVANLDTFIRFNYEKYNFKVNTHIAIEYSNNLISQKNRNPHFGPKLEGVSGSGLWHFQMTQGENLIEPKLIGIIIEQIKETGNKAIIATRIDHPIKFLNKQFDLKLLIPKQSNKYE
jgi:hypothetical protein